MDRRRVGTAVAIHGTREKESQGALTKGYIIPRAPVPSPQVRWLDPPNPPQPSSQEVVGALGNSRLKVKGRSINHEPPLDWGPGS